MGRLALTVALQFLERFGAHLHPLPQLLLELAWTLGRCHVC